VNGKDRKIRAAYDRAMRLLLALLAFLLIAAAAPRVAVGPVRACDAAGCADVDLQWFPVESRQAVLVRTVTVRPDALPLDRPLMVRLVAMASAEVRWNGVVIGRNGTPGRDAASEEPGRFVASFLVPPHLVRLGDNIVEARLSAHHLWLPVRRPVHAFSVGPYESDPLPGLADYLPALLALGALAGAGLYFAVAWRSDRDRGALLLASIAAAAMLQLLAEVSRAFVAYTYPWHLARVGGVAVLAAVVAVLTAAYAARRFAPDRRGAIALCTAGAAAASLVFVPYYDLKAISAILAGAGALGLCAWRGRDERGSRWTMAAAFAVPALLAWQLTAFLDQGWFLLVAGLLVLLVAEQVSSLRRARAERDAETRRAAALAARLARAEREGEPILSLKEGTRSHRVAESDILYVRAADDYCEAVLTDGRVLLVTMTLARLLETLPARFVRVHKSYAVNRAHVTSTAPRPGGGRALKLSDGSDVPVGRSYAASVAASIS
jgi:DNA-binding LytR/AlgR family response regulator